MTATASGLAGPASRCCLQSRNDAAPRTVRLSAAQADLDLLAG
jgi:hypothetical protein